MLSFLWHKKKPTLKISLLTWIHIIGFYNGFFSNTNVRNLCHTEKSICTYTMHTYTSCVHVSLTKIKLYHNKKINII